MEKEDVNFANQVILKLVRGAGNLLKLGDQLFKPFNVTVAQYNVLVVLNEAKDKLSQQELSKELVVTRADITAIVDRLEKSGYVKRMAHITDRRKKLLEITPKGLEVIKKVEDKYFENVKKVTEGISISELKQADEFIRKLNIWETA